MTSPTDALLALRDALRAVWDAEERCLSLSDPSGTLSGDQDAGEVRLTLAFVKPLRAELAVRKLRESDYWEFFHDPEITFDDPEFDETVLVRGKGPVGVLLDSEARALLLGIAKSVRELTLSQTELSVWCPPDAALADIAHDLVAVSRVLTETGPGQRSAYR